MHDSFEKLGFGLGLRHCHYADILNGQHQVQWFEAITENYLGLPNFGPGPNLEKLRRVRAEYPIVLHGVSLSLGGTHPLDLHYLDAVQSLIDMIEPAWVSDHLCWTGVHGRNSHDLLPLPYTNETVQHVCERIQKVQEHWQRPLVIENVSSYVTFKESQMSESEFVRAIVEKSGCKLLLDVNNIYVSSRNHEFKTDDYLKDIPWPAVVQLHLAGHTDKGHVVIDTHNAPVRPEVWKLYEQVLCYMTAVGGDPAVMIERDDQIPSLAEMNQELLIARRIYTEVKSVTPSRHSNALL